MPHSPVILHIPHSSTIIPYDLRDRFPLTDDELAAELLAMTDSFTDELFAGDESFVRIVYPVSRLVVDPERFSDDAVEIMVDRGMGVIYTRTSAGSLLRDTPSSDERRELLRRFYEPHHARFSQATDDALREHAACLIIDCHSFPSQPLPYELMQSPNRPDFCIGTDDYHTPPQLVAIATQYLEDAGYSVAINHPFAGTIVPMAHYNTNACVSSLMIEVNRGLYMDEATGEQGRDFHAIALLLGGLLSVLTAA